MLLVRSRVQGCGENGPRRSSKHGSSRSRTLTTELLGTLLASTASKRQPQHRSDRAPDSLLPFSASSGMQRCRLGALSLSSLSRCARERAASRHRTHSKVNTLNTLTSRAGEESLSTGNAAAREVGQPGSSSPPEPASAKPPNQSSRVLGSFIPHKTNDTSITTRTHLLIRPLCDSRDDAADTAGHCS